jgi:hypothetical protein
VNLTEEEESAAPGNNDIREEGSVDSGNNDIREKDPLTQETTTLGKKGEIYSSQKTLPHLRSDKKTKNSTKKSK